MGTTKKFPIDFEACHKGHFIPREHLEDVFQAKVGSAEYGFRSMALIKEVETYMRGKGEPAKVVSKDYGIRILTDDEALDHLDGSFRSSIKSMIRDHYQLCEIDETKLPSDDRRTQHQRTILSQGFILSSIRKGQKDVALPSYKRLVPPVLTTKHVEKKKEEDQADSLEI